MKYILIVIVFTIAMLAIIIPLENQLSDCRFEGNHLQTKVNRLEALGEYETALYQLMPPLAWAQLRASNEIIKQEKQINYEGKELPLLTKKEIDG